MKVLVACEFSGVVRDAFLERGHDAVSCDFLPTERPGPHHQGDMMDLVGESWDLIIAHPPCTYLCNSGVRWLYEKEGRWDRMHEASQFFTRILTIPAPRIAVENPTMHKHAGIRSPDFAVQPWQFGDPFTKRTCFWTKGLPPLKPTHGKPDVILAECHRMPPSADRWKKRSVTYPGIARAMAEQWGGR